MSGIVQEKGVEDKEDAEEEEMMKRIAEVEAASDSEIFCFISKGGSFIEQEVILNFGTLVSFCRMIHFINLISDNGQKAKPLTDCKFST